MSVRCTCIRLMGEGKVKGGDDMEMFGASKSRCLVCCVGVEIIRNVILNL